MSSRRSVSPSVLVAAALAAAMSSGCYELSVRNGLPINPSPAIHERSTGAYMYGLADEDPLVNPAAVCPNGWAEIYFKVSFVNGLLNSVRGLFFESTSLTLRCAATPGAPPPGAVLVVPPPPPALAPPQSVASPLLPSSPPPQIVVLPPGPLPPGALPAPPPAVPPARPAP